ncbi:MAG: hypothetical protein Ct9H90mP20_5930 [Candidatus Neomarinimicrobiota bacterium]|nr:MAG: hypothetical protein Ct9H90mP20_5930 [Candidatus Neomarinimicrobiota bacterium]
MSELPDRFPRGWFVLGHKEILRREYKNYLAFNRKLLVPRNSDNSISLDPGNGESWPHLKLIKW